MFKRSAIVGLIVTALLVGVAPAHSAERAVLAEEFGASWCSHCPKSRDALVALQEEFGTDDLVFLYYHVNDAYATTETNSRAAYYGVGGIPHVRIDAVHTIVGAVSEEWAYNTFKPLITQRLATPSPVTIRSKGIITDADGWVTAVFTAVDTIDYTALRAQFVVYEDLSSTLPRTVRDILPVEPLTLSAPGDSVEVTRNFTMTPAWDEDNCHVAVFVEATTDTMEIINAQLMPDPYNPVLASDTYAKEIDYFGEAIYNATIRNAGVLTDTITLNIVHDLPGNPWEWVAYYCIDHASCYFDTHNIVLEPGEVESIEVFMTDGIGTYQDVGFATLTAMSNGDTTITVEETYATFCDLPSLLVVDDDGGASHETYMVTALEDTGYPSRVWDANSLGRPSLKQLASYSAVFWTTAAGDCSYFGPLDEQNIMDYLDGGGNLFLASMDYLNTLSGPTTFTTDYLHLDSWMTDSGGYLCSGVPGDFITDGMTLGLLNGPIDPNYGDIIVPVAPADSILYTEYGVRAIKVSENDHRLIFLAVPFEDIKTGLPDPNNQRTFVWRAMRWFGPSTGVEDEPTLETGKLALRQNYPNPFNPATSIQFTLLGGGGGVKLAIYNVNGQVVRTLVDGTLPGGPHKVVWNGKDDRGLSAASGVYFCRLETDGETRVRKMALLK